MSKQILVAIAAAVALVATATPTSAAPIAHSNQLPKQIISETKVPERWFTPQVVNPGAQAVATNGQRGEAPNRCSFPFRFWAYHSLTPTPLHNGDLRLHIIRVISYQTLDARRTVFETDNFHVLIHHTHPPQELDDHRSLRRMVPQHQGDLARVGRALSNTHPHRWRDRSRPAPRPHHHKARSL
jgi:hypothetical protein